MGWGSGMGGSGRGIGGPGSGMGAGGGSTGGNGSGMGSLIVGAPTRRDGA